MNKYLVMFGVVALLSPVIMGGDCEVNDDQHGARFAQAQKAKEAANAVRFDENAEIDNIRKRIELTSAPGLLGYVTLINRVGQAVMYTPVQGKITSGGKRLTPPQKEWSVMGNNNAMGPAPSDEGTWGESNPYVYFWTPGGQYFQTSLDYVYSDKPYRLKEVPLIELPATPEVPK